MNIEQIFENHDFYQTTTGGGCMAYRHDMENGFHIVITDWEGSDVPRDKNERCVVGLYDKDGTTQHIWDCDDVEDALHTSTWTVREYFATVECTTN